MNAFQRSQNVIGLTVQILIDRKTFLACKKRTIIPYHFIYALINGRKACSCLVTLTPGKHQHGGCLSLAAHVEDVDYIEHQLYALGQHDEERSQVEEVKQRRYSRADVLC